MNSSHPSTRESLRALVLSLAWLSTPLMSVTTGAAHAAVTGTVVTWGDNYLGQTDLPAGLTDVRAIVAGEMHTLALKRDGTVVAWGNPGYGQSNLPNGLRDIMAIANPSTQWRSEAATASAVSLHR
jgi:alpha-tubulin suppressor-like RCC1 family protein